VGKPERVLVTGGAGFIGSHFVDKLVSEGYNVRVLDNLSGGKLENLSGHLKAKKVDFVKGDILDSILVNKCLENVDAVVHFAAQISVTFSNDHPDFTFEVNSDATQNLLNACVKENVGKFVLASSCAVYGDPDPKSLPINETCKTNPISPYAESKLLAENFCFQFDKEKLLQSIVLRFFNVYGTRQVLNDYSGVITRFISRIREKKPLTIYGDGLQSRDFVNVKDIIEAVFAAMQNVDAHGQVFNIGSGKPTSINELAKILLELAGVDLEVCHEKPRAGEIKHSYGDITKAREVLGYEPKVLLKEGLHELL
jgi:UDP-glucose 4-epimerase